VGLEVAARSILAGVLDTATGQVWSRRLPAATEAVVRWVGSLPGPVGVAEEAGPTGLGLARALQAAGVGWVVVAPSKLERPPGGRVKTDRRDAQRLARLLHLGGLPRCGCRPRPGRRRGALVRARQDARAALLRPGSGGRGCRCARAGLVGCRLDQAHPRWLASVGRAVDQPGLGVAVLRPMGRSGRAATPWRRHW
jgi:hypothetical protein